jgi:ATP-dependent DNA helicase RecQ
VHAEAGAVLVKAFKLRFDSRVDGFDDAALTTFTRGKEVLSVRDHFFLKDDVPYWSFLVSYNVPQREGEPAPARSLAADAGRLKNWDLLDEATWPLFNALRDWRAERAKAEGVPAYLILTNDVLAQVVKRRPRTLNELGQVPGLGSANLKRFGRELLAQLGVTAEPPTLAAAPQTLQDESVRSGVHGWGEGMKSGNRVNRGGGWDNNLNNARFANRNHDNPANRNKNLGFRLASSPQGPMAAVHGRPPCANAVTRALLPRPAMGPNSTAAPTRRNGGRCGASSSVVEHGHPVVCAFPSRLR